MSLLGFMGVLLVFCFLTFPQQFFVWGWYTVFYPFRSKDPAIARRCAPPRVSLLCHAPPLINLLSVSHGIFPPSFFPKLPFDTMRSFPFIFLLCFVAENVPGVCRGPMPAPVQFTKTAGLPQGPPPGVSIFSSFVFLKTPTRAAD